LFILKDGPERNIRDASGLVFGQKWSDASTEGAQFDSRTTSYNLADG